MSDNEKGKGISINPRCYIWVSDPSLTPDLRPRHRWTEDKGYPQFLDVSKLAVPRIINNSTNSSKRIKADDNVVCQ